MTSSLNSDIRKYRYRLSTARAVRGALRAGERVVARIDGLYFERVLEVRERKGILQVRVRYDKPWVVAKGVWVC